MLEKLINDLKPKLRTVPLLRNVSEERLAQRYHRFQLMRLRGERLAHSLVPGHRQLRVAATACWAFPIYSQTFVYQELAQLIRHDFDVRFLYWSLNSRDYLPSQFSSLWQAKRKLVAHRTIYERDYCHYLQRSPAKVNSLIDMVCRASHMTPGELRNEYHFKQAFSFTRMVEASRPDYLHSYFFYEGTLHTLFASYLLDIPRGVSCYADHLLDDYALKIVPLHLEQCSVVIATSHRIKSELMRIAPHVNPGKIVVKPNAIDSNRFPITIRKDPESGQPFRLACVSRVEPKKGIIYLVDAIRHLLDRNIAVQMHVLGGVDDTDSSRSYYEAVERRIQELNVVGAIHLEGRKTEAEIRAFLEKAQMFVAPFVETESGDKDGIPTALLEAMATGIPVVATDAGSITEVIDSEEVGVIVPQRDSLRIASAIERLLRDVKLRHELGHRAAERIRQRFDVDVCEGLFHNRIRAVVARGTPAAEFAPR
jgi:glycosyltransferase involved in cell wall biosynthesis